MASELPASFSETVPCAWHSSSVLRDLASSESQDLKLGPPTDRHSGFRRSGFGRSGLDVRGLDVRG